MCIIYVLYTLYTCLPENQDVQVLKVGKFSFHRIVTTCVLDFKCSLLDRERNRIMDLGLRTKKEEALTKCSRHFKEWLNHTPDTRQDLCNKKTRISATRKPGYHSFRTSATRKPRQDLCNKKTRISQSHRWLSVQAASSSANLAFTKLSPHGF